MRVLDERPAVDVADVRAPALGAEEVEAADALAEGERHRAGDLLLGGGQEHREADLLPVGRALDLAVDDGGLARLCGELWEVGGWVSFGRVWVPLEREQNINTININVNINKKSIIIT